MFGQRREMWVAVSQRGVLPKPEQEFVLHSTNQLEWEQWMKETGSTALSGPCNAFISYSVQEGTAQAESEQRWDEGCGVAAKLETAEEQNTLAAGETWWWAWARLAVAELYKRLWMEDKGKGVWPGTESTGRKKMRSWTLGTDIGVQVLSLRALTREKCVGGREQYGW